MIYFAKWKVVLIFLVCALGVIYAAPNLLGRQSVRVAEQTDVAGQYGSFSIAADGRWAYDIDTTNAEVRALRTRESLSTHSPSPRRTGMAEPSRSP